MSSYLRSIPMKFTSLVNTKRQVTNIDQQLAKHVRFSLFLDEFLGIHTGPNVTVNSKQSPIYSIVPLLSQNVLNPLVDTNSGRPKSLSRKSNWNRHQLERGKIDGINVINSDRINIRVLNSNLHIGKSHVNFKTKKENLLRMEKDLSRQMPRTVMPISQNEIILYTETSANVQNVDEKQTSEDRKPSEAQLQTVFDALRETLPLLFVKPVDYRMYTNDLVFVNNIKGTTTVGVSQYMKQISLLKLVGHLRFAYVKLSILKMTMHPEDNSIKVRWRIIGISGTRLLLTFWKFKAWNVKEQIDNQSAWYDGFSSFYINNDGKIYKHVVDKMMPDQDVEEKVKTPIETKLALFAALLSLDSHYFTKFSLKNWVSLFRVK